MLISDLSYIESITEHSVVFGGVTLTIVADASVSFGTTFTIVDLEMKSNKQGNVTKAMGTGTAIALGTDPSSEVNAYYQGFDKVKIKSRSGKGDNSAVETLTIKAMDLPY